MKDETQKAREALEKIISEKKQNKNEVILESLKETIETALKAMNLTELHKALRENSKFTGSKMMLANWLDAQGMRKKRPVADEAKAARVRGRLEAKAARAEQPKETPEPAPAPEQQQTEQPEQTAERPVKQPKPAPAPHIEAAVERRAPEQQEKPLSGAPVSVWGDDDGGTIRCPECSRQSMTRKKNDRGKAWWVCGHCQRLFADNDGKIGKELPKTENGNYYLA